MNSTHRTKNIQTQNIIEDKNVNFTLISRTCLLDVKKRAIARIYDY